MNIKANGRSVAIIEEQQREIEPTLEIYKTRKSDLVKRINEVQQLADKMSEMAMNEYKSKLDLENTVTEISQNLELIRTLSSDIHIRQSVKDKTCRESGSPIDCRSANLMRLMQADLEQFENLASLRDRSQMMDLAKALLSSVFFLNNLINEIDDNLWKLQEQMATLDKLKMNYLNSK